MIAAIGIDSVEIERFKTWSSLPEDKLLKIFSEKEINYCLSNSKKSAERFSARFAVKEAFFKALSIIESSNKIPFLEICKHIIVIHGKNGHPMLNINWNNLIENKQNSQTQYKTFLSITHTKKYATAIVIVEYQH